ncbi:MAG: hypothetical protein CMF61_00640 [Magnetococcales bacterium]|nr:hypothetical protein [Magnetococcales bacterium]|tara:strand:+ start:978 stop:1415 length:438 start_codon:yes stop_codon:yes gene_type:complete
MPTEKFDEFFDGIQTEIQTVSDSMSWFEVFFHGTRFEERLSKAGIEKCKRLDELKTLYGHRFTVATRNLTDEGYEQQINNLIQEKQHALKSANEPLFEPNEVLFNDWNDERLTIASRELEQLQKLLIPIRESFKHYLKTGEVKLC